MPTKSKQRQSTKPPRRTSDDEAALTKELDDALTRLDAGIAEERRQMEQLLVRLRTTRIAA